MKSYIRIHSAYNNEMLLETKSGDLHQWTFRGIILTEGDSRAIGTDRVLRSMEEICRSHIQKHVVMTSRFSELLRNSGAESPTTTTTSDIGQDEADGNYFLPTRDSLRRLEGRGPFPSVTAPP